MRRPRKTAAQRAYEKQSRRLLALKRAAVKLCVSGDEDLDDESGEGSTEWQLAVTDLIAAAQRFALSLSRTELRRLVK